MRELRTCDFCGADAAGAFEIVPPELEPTEAEQRRVVLCPDCRARLEGLLEPLLARARDAAVPAEPNRDATAATATEVADSGADQSDADAATADANAGAPSSLEEGITFERDEADAGSGSADEPAADSTAAEDAAGGADTADGETAREDDRNGDATGSTGRPAAYAKVVRLLRNRAFPMQRSAVEELAAGAYDLEPGEAAAIVDHAVEDGEFVEKRGELRRP